MSKLVTVTKYKHVLVNMSSSKYDNRERFTIERDGDKPGLVSIKKFNANTGETQELDLYNGDLEDLLDAVQYIRDEDIPYRYQESEKIGK